MSEPSWPLYRIMLDEFEPIIADIKNGIPLTPPLTHDQEFKILLAYLEARNAIDEKNIDLFVFFVALLCGLVGPDHYAELLTGKIRQQELGRSGGKYKALSDAEKVDKYLKWDQQIQPFVDQGYKIASLFRRLKIPKTTFYRYKAVAEERHKK